MKDNLNEERLERKLRKEWRKHFDHFEIVDETGINVISEIKIDPNIFLRRDRCRHLRICNS